jgi:hypothetical protein
MKPACNDEQNCAGPHARQRDEQLGWQRWGGVPSPAILCGGGAGDSFIGNRDPKAQFTSLGWAERNVLIQNVSPVDDDFIDLVRNIP